MNNPGIKISRIALLGMFTALAFVLGFIESLIPPFTGIPGVKAGFANIVTMAALYLLNNKTGTARSSSHSPENKASSVNNLPNVNDAHTAHSLPSVNDAHAAHNLPSVNDIPSVHSLLCVLGISAARIMLGGITYSGMSAAVYGLAGAFFSLTVMFLLARTGRFSITAVSVAGGTAHNLAQLLLAFLMLGDAVLYYLPMLIISGLTAGLIIGIIAAVLVTRLRVLL
ncbi:MAG: Gx transporter family protein [Lachnospiraceae bacterium]|nr:Gx transporter family protein [Lachnospiraceae bacterium]